MTPPDWLLGLIVGLAIGLAAMPFVIHFLDAKGFLDFLDDQH